MWFDFCPICIKSKLRLGLILNLNSVSLSCWWANTSQSKPCIYSPAVASSFFGTNSTLYLQGVSFDGDVVVAHRGSSALGDPLHLFLPPAFSSSKFTRKLRVVSLVPDCRRNGERLEDDVR